jgi:hypothetical protein
MNIIKLLLLLGLNLIPSFVWANEGQKILSFSGLLKPFLFLIGNILLVWALIKLYKMARKNSK